MSSSRLTPAGSSQSPWPEGNVSQHAVWDVQACLCARAEVKGNLGCPVNPFFPLVQDRVSFVVFHCAYQAANSSGNSVSTVLLPVVLELQTPMPPCLLLLGFLEFELRS